MAWTLNGTRIFVQKISGEVKAIIAKLQPLGGGTVYQSFGYETNARKVSGFVVGDSDLQALEALTVSGYTSVDLTAPEGSLGNYFVEIVTHDREKTISQTIRPDLDCASPVYSVEVTLLEDV